MTMDLEILESGAEKYGTPLYIFDKDEALETADLYRKIVRDRVKLCFAMKANPFLVKSMAGTVDRIEVCSMGEFHICRELGIPPEKMLISGVLKKKADLEKILGCCRGKALYSVESVRQFVQIAEWSAEHRKTVPIYLRLSSGNQFGMDEDTVCRIASQAKRRCFYLDLRGIHYFSGTRKKIKKCAEELDKLDGFLLKLERKYGCRMEELEYGPGLLVPCFQGEKSTVKEDLRGLSQKVSRMRWKGSVTFEMGRAFTASCGYYLTRVQDMKRRADGGYCIVDGGIHQLQYDGQILGMYPPKIRVSPKRTVGKTVEWGIYGSLCTANDILAQRIALKGLKTGDILIFENAGAYSAMEGMALFLSHELPGIVLYSRDKKWEPARDRFQTYRLNMTKETNYGNIIEDSE